MSEDHKINVDKVTCDDVGIHVEGTVDPETAEAIELVRGIEETLTWLNYLAGYTAGYKAGGGDVSTLDALRQVNRDADVAYREHIAEQEQREAEAND